MGYNISGKVLAVIIIVAVAIALICFAAIFNIGGLGATLAGAGGPVATGFYNIGVAPLNWGLSGGWPTLAVFYLLGFVVFPCAVAYMVWHFDLPIKITGATQESPATGFDNTASREPQEPERAPQSVPQAT